MMIFTTSADASINHLVSFVLPTSISRDLLCGVCLQVEAAFGDQPWEYEIVTVDDGQSHAARAALRQLSHVSPSRYRFQEFDEPVSRQQALMAGVIAVKGKVIVLMDEVPHDFNQQLKGLMASLQSAYPSPQAVSVATDECEEFEAAELYCDHWSQVA